MNCPFKILRYHYHIKGIISIQFHESLTLRSICSLNIDFIHYGHSKTRNHCLLQDAAELNNTKVWKIVFYTSCTTQMKIIFCTARNLLMSVSSHIP